MLSEKPIACAGVAEAIHEVLRLGSSKTEDLRSFERDLHAAVLEVGRAVLAERLRALSPPGPFEEGGRRWKATGPASTLTVVTLFGPVEIERDGARLVLRLDRFDGEKAAPVDVEAEEEQLELFALENGKPAILDAPKLPELVPVPEPTLYTAACPAQSAWAASQCASARSSTCT